MTEVPTQPTLHHAWLNQGEWLSVDSHFKSSDEAMLQWSQEDGWILTFRSSTDHTQTHRLTFHRERELNGHSWPGGWSLYRLARLSVSTWQEHVRDRKRTRRMSNEQKARRQQRSEWQSSWLR